MNVAILVRAAKLIALLGFFLPWATVSCSGQDLASLTGIDLATGNLHLTNPMTGAVENQRADPMPLVILAIAAAALGLALSFAGSARTAAILVLVTSLIGVGASLAAMNTLRESPAQAFERHNRDRGAGASSYERQAGAAAVSMLRVRPEGGYWLTLIGFIGAGTLAGAIAAGHGRISLPGGADPDVAAWDRIVNKDDPDALREYLLRFPTGRFAELARDKLARQGVAPLTPPAPDEAASVTAPANATPHTPHSLALPLIIGGAILAALLAIGAFMWMQSRAGDTSAETPAPTAAPAPSTAEVEAARLAGAIAACEGAARTHDAFGAARACADIVWSADVGARTRAETALREVLNETVHAREASVPLATVPPIFVDDGTCPGEGCQYGVWRAESSVDVFDAPNRRRIGALTGGERVIAIRGHVRVTPRHGVVVRASGPYQPGDEIYLLTSLGEGFFRIWHKGAIRMSGEEVNPDCEGEPSCLERQIFQFDPGEAPQEWWAQVRRENGQEGWVLNSGGVFVGADAFE